MEGTRCPSCGETRWQLTSFSLTRAKKCPMCGTDVLPERRMPGRRRTTSLEERRDTDEIAAISADVASPPTATAG